MFELFGAYTTSVAIGVTSDVAARVQQRAVEKVNGNILILLLQSVSYLAATMVLNTHLLTHSPNHLLTHSPNHLLTHSLTHSLTFLLTHSLTYSLTYLLTHSLTHLTTYSLTHSPNHLGDGPLLRQTLRLLR